MSKKQITLDPATTTIENEACTPQGLGCKVTAEIYVEHKNQNANIEEHVDNVVATIGGTSVSPTFISEESVSATVTKKKYRIEASVNCGQSYTIKASAVIRKVFDVGATDRTVTCE